MNAGTALVAGFSQSDLTGDQKEPAPLLVSIPEATVTIS